MNYFNDIIKMFPFFYSLKRLFFLAILLVSFLVSQQVFSQVTLPKCQESGNVNICTPAPLYPIMTWPKNPDGAVVIPWRYHRSLNNTFNSDILSVRNAIELSVEAWNLALFEYGIRFQFDNAVALFDDCPLQGFVQYYFGMALKTKELYLAILVQNLLIRNVGLQIMET